MHGVASGQGTQHEDDSWTAHVSAASLSLNAGSTAATSGGETTCMSAMLCAPVELRESFVWGVSSPAHNQKSYHTNLNSNSPTADMHAPQQGAKLQFELLEQDLGVWQGQSAAVTAFAAMHAAHADMSPTLRLRVQRQGGSWLQRSVLSMQQVVGSLLWQACGTYPSPMVPVTNLKGAHKQQGLK